MDLSRIYSKTQPNKFAFICRALGNFESNPIDPSPEVIVVGRRGQSKQMTVIIQRNPFGQYPALHKQYDHYACALIIPSVWWTFGAFVMENALLRPLGMCLPKQREEVQ